VQKQEAFQNAAEANAFDRDFRRKIGENISNYEAAFSKGLQQYSNLELARERAAYLKWKVIESLDKYLIEFEASVIRRGGKVLWAHDEAAALQEISQIIKRTGAKTVVKGKTMVGEEIGINDFLRKAGVTVHETDLGEYIVDQAGEPPFHMVTPAMHKSREEVARLLNEKIGSSLDASIDELSMDVRSELRDKFVQADIGITGANFLVADSGMVAITENEGNGRLSFTFPKTHLVLAGIEKVLPTLNDLDIFLPLLATYGTGQKITAYNTIVGARESDENEGPSEFIVLLVDNGRSNLLAQPDQRQALGCIKCGACLNVCPVFKNIGGPAYGTTYTGPIGAVITPHQQGLAEYKHLSYASTLCGRCTDVCPVKIDLHNHLSRNRRDSVADNARNSEKLMWYTWKKMMLNRKTMNRGASVKNFMLKSFFRNGWGNRREFPKIVDKSFNQLWREKFGG
jgi:L-lactate dehydrogenase complex protein LldF